MRQISLCSPGLQNALVCSESRVNAMLKCVFVLYVVNSSTIYTAAVKKKIDAIVTAKKRSKLISFHVCVLFVCFVSFLGRHLTKDNSQHTFASIYDCAIEI